MEKKKKAPSRAEAWNKKIRIKENIAFGVSVTGLLIALIALVKKLI